LGQQNRRKQKASYASRVNTCPATPAPKRERIEPSVHTTTSDAESLLRKSAAASGLPGSERKQPSMKVVTVQFRESKGEWVGGHKIRFSLGVLVFLRWAQRSPGRSFLHTGCIGL